MDQRNKFINDLFNESIAKPQEPQDEYAKLGSTLDKLRNMLAPLFKSVGQGMRTAHKYIKRTGGPGNYKYWYKDPVTGSFYAADKPQNPAHAGLNAGVPGSENQTVKNVTVQGGKEILPGWATSSKVPNTINNSQYGSITFKLNDNGTRSAIHNGAVIKDKTTGQSQFEDAEQFNHMVKNYIDDLGQQRLSQVQKRVVVVKPKQ